MKALDVNQVSSAFRTIRQLNKENARLKDVERERDELAAHVERAQRLADQDRVSGEFYDEDGDLREGTGWQSKLGRDLHAALKVTPAASLAAHDAALLNKCADALEYSGIDKEHCIATLRMNADNIERGDA